MTRRFYRKLGVDNEMGAILTYGTEVATTSFEVLELVIPWFVVKITLSSNPNLNQIFFSPSSFSSPPSKRRPTLNHRLSVSPSDQPLSLSSSAPQRRPARGTRKTRARDAALNAIQSPLLDIGIERATGIVWNITDGSDLTLFEMAYDLSSERNYHRLECGLQGTMRMYEKK
ncbi:uncharacterized protein [Nicotiana tomentosiformis]|uniref:uncharacterized protein n=1 Tax=Nicotiana tomentosiformis TaxID=4098 RepID=UPI00388C6430